MKNSTNGISRVLDRLNSALPNKVTCKGEKAYNASNTTYWSKEEAEIVPACIVLPSDARDVAVFIKTINEIKIDYPQMKFAVRGGGHAPGATIANIQDGVTIDMRGLNGIELSPDLQICQVGAGSLWGDIYTFLDTQSLSVVGGRGSSIGVGGLTTGGGISFFSGRKGFSCDNIVNYQIVLANSDIVQANEKVNPDLFRALKGGSNNFGVVTRFDMKTFTTGDFWGGLVVWSGEAAVPQLMDAFTKLNLESGCDENAALILAFSWVVGAGEFPSVDIKHTQHTTKPPVFEDFATISGQASNSLRVSNHTGFTTEFVQHSAAGRRQLYVTNTFKNDRQAMQDIYTMAKTAFADLPQQPFLTLSMAIQPITPAMIQQSVVQGGNMLGLRSEEGPLVLCLFAISFDDPSAESEVQRIARKLNDDTVAYTKSRGLWHPWIYLNYAATWQDPISSYGEENKKFMQTVSKKYDPEGLFQKHLPGGFKLFL